MSVISGNMVGGAAPLRTLILTDESGNELVGVVTENAQVFNATPADVRINKTFVSDNGIETGENTITYRTWQGTKLILSGQEFSIPLDLYDQYNYTKLQCIVTKYSSNADDRMAATKIILNDGVYNVGSSVMLAEVTKNASTKSIDFNITNDTNDIYMIHYFTYKEEEF